MVAEENVVEVAVDEEVADVAAMLVVPASWTR